MTSHRQKSRLFTPEEQLQRSISARRKFKAIVRLIVSNLSWLQEVEDENLGDNVRKNIQVLTRKKGKKSLLTLQDKSILNKPVEERTKEEIERLRLILSKIKCFRNWPKHIKDQLPTICHFCFYSGNRTLLKQNYEALNMYVILTGEVVLSQTYYDKLLKETVSKDVMVMGAGTHFGEVCFLLDIKRLNTVKTTQASEFLYIKKEDFDRVLKEFMTTSWNETMTNIQKFSYFKKWSASDIRDCCIIAKKNIYQADQVILSATGGQSDCVYFVTKGSCYLLEHMTIKKEYKNGKTLYHLISDEQFNVEEEQRKTKALKKLYAITETEEPETKLSLRPAISGSVTNLTSSTKQYFMKICSFNKMACFNVGESLKNRIIVADTDMECLLVSRHFLLEKGSCMFQTVAEILKHTIPNTEKVFKIFIENQKWTQYKKKLIKELLRGKKTVNHIYNVPYTVRIMQNY